jgi:hypothetical protein
VSKTEIQMAVDQHHHDVEGVQYQFKVVWAGSEPRWSSRSRRYVVAIEVLAEDRIGSSPIHIVVGARTSRAELLRLVADALELLIRESRHRAEAHTPELLSA